jgi:tRNA pseudouridine38-40 synthase
MRYFIELSYNGSTFHGWQIQPNTRTIQEEINLALSTILKKKISVVGAGRTDTGVHAEKMCAHFDYKNNFDIGSIIKKLNGFLPNSIMISKIYKVKDNAHSRFDALNRTYKYYISNKRDLFNQNIYLHFKELDIKAMNSACNYLLGKQDFTSFSKLNTQTYTNNCEIISINFKQENEYLLFTIKANRFLRNMVRAIVGTLIKVGEHKIEPIGIKQIIEKKDRCKAGSSLPAHALFLVDIEYPKSII